MARGKRAMRRTTEIRESQVTPESMTAALSNHVTYDEVVVAYPGFNSEALEDEPFDSATLEHESDEILLALSNLCEADDIDAENCIGCRAGFLLYGRIQAAGADGDEAEAAALHDHVFSQLAEAIDQPVDPQGLLSRRLDTRLMHRDVILGNLDLLNQAVVEYFDPIRGYREAGVSKEDVLVLANAARQFVRTTQALGSVTSLNDEQKAMLAEVSEVLARL